MVGENANENRTGLVSVIIPIYNKEKKLKRCIDSVLKQTYKNLEIILIDDGSTDGSGKICEDYARDDARITVIRQENGGVSRARNRGIAEAHGEYIEFVDADEYLDENMVESVISSAKEKGAEVTICGYKQIFSDRVRAVSETPGSYTINEFIPVMARWKLDPLIGAPWNKLMLRKAVLDSHVEYEPRMIYAEDYDFNVKLFSNISRVEVSDKCLYNYDTLTEGSLTKKNTIGSDVLWKAQLKILEDAEVLEKVATVGMELTGQLLALALALNFSRRIEENDRAGYESWRRSIVENDKYMGLMKTTKRVTGYSFEDMAYRVFRLSILTGTDRILRVISAPIMKAYVKKRDGK